MLSFFDMDSSSRSLRFGLGLSNVLLWFAIAFGVLAVISIGFGIARGGDSLLYGNSLQMPVEIAPDTISPLEHGLDLRGWPKANASIHDPTTKQMLLRSLQDIAPLSLFIVCLWLLRGFLRTVLEGEPFGRANVRRLRAIGTLLVAGAPFVALFDYSLRQALFDNAGAGFHTNIGIRGFEFPGMALLGGIAAYILAEVFAYGTELREDVEATV
ncbi:MAG: hypothetical protein QOJ29_5074 [Thermoleophilaceae bacterium]|jgi:hypothetical protein|nr:hypothetical protein [Thermoleophilaceae bacterium]